MKMEVAATVPLLFDLREKSCESSEALIETVTDPEKCPSSIATSSVLQATVNSTSLLFGIGFLSAPYALEEGGWLGLIVLLVFGGICCYTAYTLGCCLESGSNVTSYQDIGAKAYGLHGRVLVTGLLYVEIFAVLVGYTISLGDNLSKIFPHVNFEHSWLHLTAAQFLTIITILIILPTVWLRNLSSLSYLSLSGIATFLVVTICIAWAGIYGGVGFFYSVPAIRPSNIPAIAGLYAYCYSGHVIFPTIYSSMKDPSKFPKVLVVSFTSVTSVYILIAFLGARMYGDAIQSQITLNMPINLLATKIALWVVVISPLSKYALSIAPLAIELDNHLPPTLSPRSRHVVGLLFRTSLLIAILLVALAFPFFGYVLSFVGSALSITMSIILPCVFYVKIFHKSTRLTILVMNATFISVGVIFGIIGTISSLKSLILEISDSL